jgi:hypothetical protein
MSPCGSSEVTSSTARDERRGEALVVLGGGSYSTSTGNVRPSTCTTGAPPKKAEKRSVSMVAELTITLRSGRSGGCGRSSRARNRC